MKPNSWRASIPLTYHLQQWSLQKCLDPGSCTNRPKTSLHKSTQRLPRPFTQRRSVFVSCTKMNFLLMWGAQEAEKAASRTLPCARRPVQRRSGSAHPGSRVAARRKVQPRIQPSLLGLTGKRRGPANSGVRTPPTTPYSRRLLL